MMTTSNMIVLTLKNVEICTTIDKRENITKFSWLTLKMMM